MCFYSRSRAEASGIRVSVHLTEGGTGGGDSPDSAQEEVREPQSTLEPLLWLVTYSIGYRIGLGFQT